MDFVANARRQMLAGQLNDARRRLMASFEGLSDEQMRQPGACGDWSVREALAHVAAWDRANTEGFRQMLQGKRPAILDLDEDGIEAFNRQHHAVDAGVTVEQAIAELEAARVEMVALLRDISNQALFAPAPGDDTAELSIAACVQAQAIHDEEHAELIEDWRAAASTEA